VNDGMLVEDAPTGRGEFDEYRVDPTTTTGPSTRWDNAVGAGGPMSYGDLAGNDTRSLTYTSEPLVGDRTVVGHPQVSLWVTSSSGDADVHVLLEEVDERGGVRYVTEGVLRASHRSVAEAPWDNLGLPYRRSFRDDCRPLSAEEPEELLLALHPTATVFDAGHRIRLTVMGADADNTALDPQSAAATIRVSRDLPGPSFLDLPTLP
jgi:putative CocE/NonD family hydrolase